ncbi:MAG: 2-amino-4-hydroxy-6-hydroxymethyldihydropteridine diphosphokinase [Vampirovibrio sp.]|nr:2-amino-4-hydroxy-6-hydroxymethyldihydropteridine diphosphokinase [Vampirovibrio sp.]
MTSPSPVFHNPVYLSLGSNQGDRAGLMNQALALLEGLSDTSVVQSSCLYQTEPQGPVADQPWFLNAVVKIETTLTSEALLICCREIETALGRNRATETPQGPRTLDIDILFCGSQVLDTPDLKIPHPRLHQRAFVLVPLLEIAPTFLHPQLGRSIEQLHMDLDEPGEVGIYTEAVLSV